MATTYDIHDDPTVPRYAVTMVPSPPETVPLRNPDGTWALVVTTVGLTPAGCGGEPTAPDPDPAHTDIAALFAGIWLPTPPPATLHRGDVVVRLTSPADLDPRRADIEVLAADDGQWRSVRTLHALDARWPHHVATTVLSWMRALAADADRAVIMRGLATSRGIDRAPAGLVPDGLDTALHPDGLDALAALIDARLVTAGDSLTWDVHTATVCPGGALLRGESPHELRTSAVSALATSLASPVTVNGWHLWRLVRDGRTLADLRAELTAR
ncbi:hypothetical protein PV458_31350 [Streptomyces sp. MN03-5084-2B]|nr:hypothetical protein [Streptomyces sp. MN03-5084-2B]